MNITRGKRRGRGRAVGRLAGAPAGQRDRSAVVSEHLDRIDADSGVGP